MPDFLTTMSTSTIGIIIGVVAIAAAAGYLFWAKSEGSWPFDQ